MPSRFTLLNGDSGEAYSLSLYDYEHPPAKIERNEAT